MSKMGGKTSFGILLINTGADSVYKESIREKYNFPPYGLLSMASVLKAHGYQVFLIDLLTEAMSYSEFINRIQSIGVPILAVGIPTYTESFHLAIEAAQIVRKILPSAKIIFGGVHVSFLPGDGLAEPSVDFIVRGEGEGTLIALLEHIKYPQLLEPTRIKGIAFRGTDGETVCTDTQPFITNVDILPLPDYQLIAANPVYSETISVISSRGCPGECIFCASRAFSGKKYRMHSAWWLFSLLLHYHERVKPFRVINFMDDTFTASKRRLRLFKRLVEYQNWRHVWACKSRVDTINAEIADLLAASGCRSIHIGVESGDQHILNTINKGVTLRRIFDTLNILYQSNMRIECSFVIGLPADTRETIDKTLILAHEINVSGVGFSSVGISAPFPGTRMYNEADELGLIIHTRKWKNYTTRRPVYETNAFTLDDLRKANYIFYSEKSKMGDVSIISQSDMRWYRAWVQELLARIKSNTYYYTSPEGENRDAEESIYQGVIG